jgi:serine/threonine protein kinase
LKRNIFKQDLVLQCLQSDPLKRPTARQLLFHPALFEIPSLKLLSVHSLADDIRKNILILSSYLFNYQIGLKPDRSFVSPIVHPIPNDQIFAELESNREGVKPVIYT